MINILIFVRYHTHTAMRIPYNHQSRGTKLPTPNQVETVSAILFRGSFYARRMGRRSDGRAILRRRLACMSLEEADEMLGIFEAEALADLRDGERLVVEQLLGGGKKVAGDEVLGRTAGLNPHQLAKIAAGETAFVSEIGHRGQALAMGFRGDIVLQQRLKLLHNGMVYLLARHELTVVEAQTIVQKQLDVGHDQVTAMLVDGAAKLLTNHVEHATEYLYLARR